MGENWITGKPMACAIGFPVIGVGGTGGEGIFSFVRRKKRLSFCGRRLGKSEKTARMYAN